MNIYFKKEPLDRFWHFIDAVSTEIGGFGYATIEAHDIIVVDTLYPVAQYATAGEVDFIEGGGVAEAIGRCVEDGRFGDPNFIWLSWHSHNTMSVFWSNKDEDCISQYADQGIPNLLSIVGNHKHEYKLRLDCFGVESNGLLIEHVQMHDLNLKNDPDDPAFDVEVEAHPWDLEVRQAIREKPPEPTKAWTISGVSDGDLPRVTQFRTGPGKKAGIYIHNRGWVDIDPEELEINGINDANKMLKVGQAVCEAVETHESELTDLAPGEFEAMVLYYELTNPWTEHDFKVKNDEVKELTA